MANIKNNAVQQKLSPENYIRQKARNLPIHECWVSSNWETSGTATVCVSRIHSNGNLTLGLYLIDLFCLGIKDTLYFFNYTMIDYNNFINGLKEKNNIVLSSYELVHNIIFASKEYAEDLGFKPHKDFTSVSQYILSEDNEDIELIDIACGCNGKPMFINTEFTPKYKAQSIINTLDKTVGKGNYNVVMNDNFDDFDEDVDYDEDDVIDEDDIVGKLVLKYNLLSKDERLELFKELTSRGLKNTAEEDKPKVIALTDSIYFNDLCNDREVKKIYKRWSMDFKVYIDEALHTWESLGLESEREITANELKEFNELDDLINKKSKKVKKRIEELREKWGNIPYLDYVELNYLEFLSLKLYKARLIELETKLKDYSYYKMDLYRNKNFEDQVHNSEFDVIDIDHIFDGRESVTPKEMITYLSNKIFALQARNIKNELEAFYLIISNLDLSEYVLDSLKTVFTLIRIESLINDFN